jgi:hypothetical protein
MDMLTAIKVKKPVKDKQDASPVFKRNTNIDVPARYNTI